MRPLHLSVSVAVLLSGVAFAFTACKSSRGAMRGQMPDPPTPAAKPVADRRAELPDEEHKVVRGVFSYTEMSDSEEFYRLFADPLMGRLLGRDVERYYFHFTSMDAVCAIPCAKVNSERLAAVIQAKDDFFLGNPNYPQIPAVRRSPEYEKWVASVKWVK